MVRFSPSRILVPAVVAILAAAAGCAPKPGSSEDDEVLDQPSAGEIEVDNLFDGQKTYGGEIGALFVESSSGASCTITSSGPCRLISCSSAWVDLARDTAGTLTISAGSAPINYTPDQNGYSVSSSTTALFQPGASVSVSAAGGTTPPFSGTVTGPGPVTVTAPTGTALSVVRTMDLNLAWTGSSAGEVVFQLVSGTDSPKDTFECRFPATGSSGTVPSSALALLSPGTYTADVFSRSRDVVTAQSWSVAIDARCHAGTSANAAFKQTASVQ